ncbi:AMP-binding protein [Devosia sp. CN2-171]|uniref:AMP-binding protein n=1 Tax=Devosia sp. CN2-171 TaxID=3400909 RepID=UPI003BF793E5
MQDYSQAHLTQQLVYESARAHPERSALLFQGRGMSYDKLADSVARSRSYFGRIGVGPGDRVLLLLPDCPSFVIAFFGIIAAGGIPVPLSTSVDIEEAAGAVSVAQPIVIIVDERSAVRFKPLLLMEGVETVIIASWSAPAEFEREMQLCNADHSIIYAPDRLAYGLFSSGSTGAPKLIPHRHKDLLLAYDSYASPHVGYRYGDICLAVPKLHFGYGLGNNLAFPLRAGAAVILFPEAPNASVLIEAALAHAPTLFFSQPRALAELLGVNTTREAMGSVRLCVSAGEPLHNSLIDRWRALTGTDIYDSYGTTEVGHVFMVPTPGNHRPGSVGGPIAGCDIVLRDPEGRPTEETLGELWVRTPSAANCYWNNRAASEDVFQDGWVRTRDTFFRDEHGRFYPRGRVDDLIKLGCGKWVNPTDVEQLLTLVPGVSECVVLGTTGMDGLTVLKAILVYEGTNNQVHAAEMAASSVREKWPNEPERWLTKVEFTRCLPKTSTGKIKRSAVDGQTMTEFAYNC